MSELSVKILAGIYKNKTIKLPSKTTTRSTKSIMKESLFNTLQFDIIGENFVEVFGGSGSMGLEALSRGAQTVDLVEFSSKAIAEIINNIKKIGCENVIKVKRKKVSDFIKKCNKKYDVIFVDPPYLKNLVNNTVKMIFDYKLLNENGIVIIEHHAFEKIDLPHLNKFIVDTRKYSKCNITTMFGGKNENI